MGEGETLNLKQAFKGRLEAPQEPQGLARTASVIHTSFFFLNLLFRVLFFQTHLFILRERESTNWGEAEKEREIKRIPSRLHAHS